MIRSYDAEAVAAGHILSRAVGRISDWAYAYVIDFIENHNDDALANYKATSTLDLEALVVSRQLRAVKITFVVTITHWHGGTGSTSKLRKVPIVLVNVAGSCFVIHFRFLPQFQLLILLNKLALAYFCFPFFSTL